MDTENKAKPANNPFKDMKMPAVNLDAMMSSYRKNIEIITAASKVASEVVQSLSQLQSKFMKQAMDDLKANIKQLSNPSPSVKVKDRVSSHSKAVKAGLGKALNHSKEMSSLLSSSSSKVIELFSNRFGESLEEMKTSFTAHTHPSSKSKH